jgi:hypothetical protein
MSFKAMAWASKQKVGKSPSKFILLMLADRANDDGYCWPSLDRIADDCEMSRSTVVRHTKFLEFLCLIEIIRRKKDGVDLPNKYQLKMEGVVSERQGGSVRETLGGSVRETHEPISIQPIKEPSIHILLFSYYRSFENLKSHRSLNPEMKKSIDRFIKNTASTIEDCQTVIRRHSKVVDLSKSSEYPIRVRSIQELFGQKVHNASHLIGSEYLDDGKYGEGYTTNGSINTSVKLKQQAHVPQKRLPSDQVSNDDLTSLMESLR